MSSDAQCIAIEAHNLARAGQICGGAVWRTADPERCQFRMRLTTTSKSVTLRGRNGRAFNAQQLVVAQGARCRWLPRNAPATCDDSATGLNETYTWNADETLASWPEGSNALSAGYDEDGHLLNLAVGGTTAYEYGYAFDGGRRWKKDIANAVWTWFPCGVACSAGDLVERPAISRANRGARVRSTCAAWAAAPASTGAIRSGICLTTAAPRASSPTAQPTCLATTCTTLSGR